MVIPRKRRIRELQVAFKIKLKSCGTTDALKKKIRKLRKMMGESDTSKEIQFKRMSIGLQFCRYQELAYLCFVKLGNLKSICSSCLYQSQMPEGERNINQGDVSVFSIGHCLDMAFSLTVRMKKVQLYNRSESSVFDLIFFLHGACLQKSPRHQHGKALRVVQRGGGKRN